MFAKSHAVPGRIFKYKRSLGGGGTWVKEKKTRKEGGWGRMVFC